MSIDILGSTDKQLKDIHFACMHDTELFAKVFMKERFYLPFSANIHKRIFEVLDDDSIRLAAISAPRGTGKTSIVTIAYPAKRLCYRQSKYILPISATTTSAVEQSENLKKELMSNELILKVFGSPKSDRFSSVFWDSAYGGRVRPLGAEQQIRGRLVGHSRPDLILPDDLENSESVDSEEQREKKRKWFYSDVLGSVNRYEKNWRIIVIGTVLHEDSLLQNLMDNPDFTHVRLEICDDEFKSNWQEVFSDSEVKRLYEQFKAAGQVDVFFREYRNLPVPTGESATFKASMFQYYSPTIERLEEKPGVVSFVIADPCKRSTPTGADSGIVVWQVDVERKRFYLADYYSGRVTTDAFYEQVMRFAIRYQARAIGVEATGIEDWIVMPLKIKLRKNGIPCAVVDLKARRGLAGEGRGSGKELRVSGLVPYYETGMIYHNINKHDMFENQLISFPKCAKWDLIDAAAYLPIMLKECHVTLRAKVGGVPYTKLIPQLPKLERPRWWL